MSDDGWYHRGEEDARMSFYSLVIISYSGLEEALQPDKLVELLPVEYRSWLIAYPREDEERALGYASECALVGHYNYFDMEEVVDVLRELPWERPQEVCIIEKDQTMDLPLVTPVFDLPRGAKARRRLSIGGAGL